MLNKINNVFSKGGDQPGMRSKKIDIISKNDYEYNQAPKSDETTQVTGKFPDFPSLKPHSVCLDSQSEDEEGKAVDMT